MPGKRGGVERRRKTRESREPGGRRGGKKALNRPGDPATPHPTPRQGRPIAHTLSIHEGRSTPPPPRGGPRRGRKTAAEPPLRTCPPPQARPPRGLPRSHTTDGRCTPSASDHHSRPRRARDAVRREHGNQPTVGKTGDRPALGQAHRSRGPRRGGGGVDHGTSPSSSTQQER